MASYKIYFLNFCHKNHTLGYVKRVVALQNASNKGVFMKNGVLGPCEVPELPVAPWNNRQK